MVLIFVYFICSIPYTKIKKLQQAKISSLCMTFELAISLPRGMCKMLGKDGSLAVLC